MVQLFVFYSLILLIIYYTQIIFFSYFIFKYQIKIICPLIQINREEQKLYQILNSEITPQDRKVIFYKQKKGTIRSIISTSNNTANQSEIKKLDDKSDLNRLQSQSYRNDHLLSSIGWSVTEQPNTDRPSRITRVQEINSQLKFKSNTSRKFFTPRLRNDQSQKQREKDFKEQQKHISILIKDEQDDQKLSKLIKIYQSFDQKSIFNQTYKNLDFFKDASNFLQIKETSKFRYFKLLKKSESIPTLPVHCGIIKNQNNQNFDLQHYKMHDQQAKLLAAVMTDLDDLEKICLAHNGIADEGTQKILESLNPSTVDLNISYNNFSTKVLINLAAFLSKSTCNLQVLNIEGNRLGDQAFKIFFNTSNSKNIRLKSLNLSRNRLSSSICVSLKKYLGFNKQLQELYLHWNRIRAEGGKIIFLAIQENATLRVLDLSHNSLGKTENKNSFLQTFKIVINSNKSLLHLDLSFNCFDYEQCKIISESINQNQTMHGFHFSGNCGFVDKLGYIRLTDNDQTQEQKHFESHDFYRINSVKIVEMNKIHGNQNCWICGGWVENTFTYINHITGPQCIEPPVIHLEEYNYIPMQMQLEEEDRYTLKVMSPPAKKQKYFYTVDGNHMAAADQKRILNLSKINVQWLNKLVIVNKLKQFNQFESMDSKKQAYHNYESIYESLPRNLNGIIFNDPSGGYVGWTYETSIFRLYKRDDEKLLDQAFEHDYQLTRLPKFFGDYGDRVQQDLKALLRQNYELIKSVYKYYSSFTPCKDVWCIGMSIFTEFLQSANFLDEKYLTLQICDCIFVSTNAYYREKGQKLNPGRCIIRPQFMEIIVRLADEQYFKSYICEDLMQAIQYFLNHLSIFSEIHLNNESQWRNTYLWTEYVDYCLKMYRDPLKMIFDKYISRKQLSKPKLLLQDFKKLIIDSQITQNKDKLKDKDINIVYNISLQTQVSEMTSERHLEMNFFEFLEAICRIAEIMSLPPYTWKYWKQTIDFQGFPLHIKIESLIQTLVRKLLVKENSVKLEFELPSQSIFEEEIALLKNFSESFKPRILIRREIPVPSVQILQNIFKEVGKQNKLQIIQNKGNDKSITGFRKSLQFSYQKLKLKGDVLSRLTKPTVETIPVQADQNLQVKMKVSNMILSNLKRGSKIITSGDFMSNKLQRKPVDLTSTKEEKQEEKEEEKYVPAIRIITEEEKEEERENQKYQQALLRLISEEEKENKDESVSKFHAQQPSLVTRLQTKQYKDKPIGDPLVISSKVQETQDSSYDLQNSFEKIGIIH